MLRLELPAPIIIVCCHVCNRMGKLRFCKILRENYFIFLLIGIY